MTTRKSRVAIVVFSLVTALAAIATTVHPRAQTAPSADLVLVNGTVLTVDANDAVARALYFLQVTPVARL